MVEFGEDLIKAELPDGKTFEIDENPFMIPDMRVCKRSLQRLEADRAAPELPAWGRTCRRP